MDGEIKGVASRVTGVWERLVIPVRTLYYYVLCGRPFQVEARRTQLWWLSSGVYEPLAPCPRLDTRLSGELMPPIRYEVMAKGPTRIVQTMQIAKLEEDKTTAFKRSSKRYLSKMTSNSQRGGAINSSTNKPTTSNCSTTTSLVNKLTNQEIRE